MEANLLTLGPMQHTLQAMFTDSGCRGSGDDAYANSPPVDAIVFSVGPVPSLSALRSALMSHPGPPPTVSLGCCWAWTT